jgi:hypothetical protein
VANKGTQTAPSSPALTTLPRSGSTSLLFSRTTKTSSSTSSTSHGASTPP